MPSISLAIMWLHVLEVWLTSRLLASPGFHRAVRAVHKKIQDTRYGKDPSEMGGTNIDKPGESDIKKFFQYYIDELRDQFRGGSSSKK